MECKMKCRVALAFFLVLFTLTACDSAGEKANKTIEGQDKSLVKNTVGFPETNLSIGWERNSLSSEKLVEVVENGIEITSDRYLPRVSLDSKFPVLPESKYKVEVDYQILTDHEGLTPEITAWCLDENGKLLEKFFNAKLFSRYEKSGTIVVEFISASYSLETSGAIALNPGTKFVVFSTNPARGKDGTRAKITRFDVSSIK